MSADFTPEKEDYKILTPFKMQVLTNFPYIEADFDALTNYQLLCKVVEYLNNVIHNENELTAQVNSLYNAYVSLQNYVNNYFDNLDVQEEINNKLDEMALDGTLTNLIKNYVDPIYQAYESSINEDLSSYKTLINGQINTINNKVNDAVSGSPLVASSTDDMTETDRVYVNTTDGKWYYYDGDSWEIGGTYQSTGIILDNTLSDNDKAASGYEVGSYLSKFFATQNLFNNEDDDIVAGYIEVTGANLGNITSNGNYSVSGKISCVENEVLMFPVYNLYGGSKKYVCGFNISDEPIRIEGTVDENNIITLTIPEDVVYIRVTVKNDEFYTFMMVKKLFGSSYPPTYIPYTDTIQIKDKINYNGVDFLVNQSHNIYNPDDEDIERGHYITDHGVTTSENENIKVSGYIPVKYGETYIFPCYPYIFGNTANLYAINCYDEDKEWIKRINGTANTTTCLNTLVINDPKVKYIRVNIANNGYSQNLSLVHSYQNEDNFMVWNGDSYPDMFYPYNELLYQNSYSTFDTKNNPLLFKKISFLGDSICEGSSAGNYDGWAGLIGRKNYMIYDNLGISGASITQIGGHSCIATKSLKTVNPDYIILEGGTNDADLIGDATGDVKPEKFGSYDLSNFGTNDEASYFGFDISTFCGAFEFMIKKFISNYPKAKIGYIIAQKMGSATQYDYEHNNRAYYFNTAKEICKKWGIPVLDLWNTSPLNPKLPVYYTPDDVNSFYVDGQHLTINGYNLITPQIESWIKLL